MTGTEVGTATTARPGQYLVLALYGFAVFGWELVVSLLLDPLLGPALGAPSAALLHGVVTAAGWIAGAWLILRSSRRLGDVFAPTLRGRALPRALVLVAALAVAVIVRMVVLQEWKPLAEYQGLEAVHGSGAPLAALVLLLYYLAEAFLLVCVLALAQRAGELRLGRPAAPWGGLLLALTWGATHILLQGPAAGLYAMGASVLYGVAYALGPRRLAASFALIAAAFLL